MGGFGSASSQGTGFFSSCFFKKISPFSAVACPKGGVFIRLSENFLKELPHRLEPSLGEGAGEPGGIQEGEEIVFLGG